MLISFDSLPYAVDWEEPLDIVKAMKFDRWVPMKFNWKWSAGILVAVAILTQVVLKLGFDLGIESVVAEAEAELSKKQAWPSNFKKSFVDSCANTNIAEEKQRLQIYCLCIADKIEAAHIVPTKYNPSTKSQKQFGEDVQQIVSDYLRSESGLKDIKNCQK